MPNTRDETFIPLTSATPGAGRLADLRVAILPSDDTTQPFRPLTQSHAAHSHANDGSEPRVTVRRDGDRVTAIEVQCACGRVIELACVYEPPAATLKV